MELDNIFAIILRLGVMVIIYYLLFQKFYRDYKKSKKQGFKNTYFLGFTVLFLILFIFHIIYGSYNLYKNAVVVPYDLTVQFPWYTRTDGFVGVIVHNQMRPAYLSFYFLLNLVLAAQIYPLEKANNWDKNPFMKFILVCGCSVWLLFIPAIGNSSFAVIPVLFAFIGIGVGFLLNIMILVKLYKNATGDVRQRALYGIFAFLFLAVGMVISMEVGWIKIFSEEISYRWEVVIGSGIQIVGAFFYYKGFKRMKLSPEEKMEAKTEKHGIMEILKGYFTRFELIDYLVISAVLGFLFLALAWMTYPLANQYSIMKDTISFLGSSDADNNPEGWWFFSVSFIIFSISLIPLALYRFRRLKVINKPLASLSMLFYLIASVGIFLVAIFPDNGGQSYFSDLSAGRVHNIVSILGFGGFGFASLIDFFLFIWDFFKAESLNSGIWLIIYIVFFIIVGMTAYTQIIWEMTCESNCWPGDGIYSFPLWEWIVFFTVFIVIYTKILSLPNDLSALTPEGS
ncbi:MAG: DUF998 domain-containing protein [Promethearchaeia archaeon]